MKRFGTSEQQLHVEVHPQEKLHPQFRKSTVLWQAAVSTCPLWCVHMVCGTLIIPLSVGGVGQERPTTAVHAFISPASV